MHHATFNWPGMGKADYSQAHAIYARLPEWVRRKLRNDEPEVLCRMIFLFWTCASRSGRGSAYCIPSEDWLASCIGKSTRTVRRCLTALKELRLISWIRRKGNAGEWLSNMYKPASTLMETLFLAFGKKPQQNHHRTNLSNNNLEKEYKASAPMQTGERLTDLVQKLRANRLTQLGAGQADSATDSW